MKPFLFFFLLLFCYSGVSAKTGAYTQDTAVKALKDQVIDQTKEGGKLDFFTPIKGKEYEAVEVNGKITTQLGVALYAWGAAVKDLGIKTEAEALLIFETFKGRKLNIREETYIKLGFQDDWKTKKK